MNWKKIAVVFRKELLDTARDRRFLYSAILVPIFLFPVMIVGFIGLAIFTAGRTQQKDQTVMVLGAEHAPELTRRIEKVRLELPSLGGGAARIDMVAAADDYVKQINDKKLQAAVEIPPQLEEKLKAEPDTKHTLKIYFLQDDIRSRTALRAVTKAIDDYSKEIAGGRLEARGLSLNLLTPFSFARESVVSAKKVSGSILGFILPYMIIILCLTGAMYPAMDLTAGEKERGTMETILSSPAGRLDIVMGKFFLVLFTAMITTLISMISMVGTALIGARFITRINPNAVLEISGMAVLAVLLLVLPLAVLFSAGLLAISVYARNYKEAQSYIGPMMFLIILPAMGSFIPGIELNTRLALVPILNISLLTKEVFGGQFQWNYIALIFGSTSVYAAAALYFALRQFQREEVVFRA